MALAVDIYSDRINRGLSQAALAAEIGVSEDVIRQVEKTGRRPQPTNALKIASHYGRTVLEVWPEPEVAAEDIAA